MITIYIDIDNATITMLLFHVKLAHCLASASSHLSAPVPCPHTSSPLPLSRLELSVSGYRQSPSLLTRSSSRISKFLFLSFQSLPHSFIFHITFNPHSSNNFPTLSQNIGRASPTWSDQCSSPTAVGGQFSAPLHLLTPFPASLTQKQGGAIPVQNSSSSSFATHHSPLSPLLDYNPWLALLPWGSEVTV